MGWMYVTMPLCPDNCHVQHCVSIFTYHVRYKGILMIENKAWKNTNLGF